MKKLKSNLNEYEIIVLHQRGYRLKDIALLYGVTEQRISQVTKMKLKWADKIKLFFYKIIEYF